MPADSVGSVNSHTRLKGHAVEVESKAVKRVPEKQLPTRIEVSTNSKITQISGSTNMYFRIKQKKNGGKKCFYNNFGHCSFTNDCEFAAVHTIA